MPLRGAFHRSLTAFDGQVHPFNFVDPQAQTIVDVGAPGSGMVNADWDGWQMSSAVLLFFSSFLGCKTGNQKQKEA